MGYGLTISMGRCSSQDSYSSIQLKLENHIKLENQELMIIPQVFLAKKLSAHRLVLNLLLALLDYVSRAHEVEIRPSSVRLSVASIISEVTAWIAFKFQL